MSLVSDVMPAARRSGIATQGLIVALTHQNTRVALFAHAAERKRSQLADIGRVVGQWLRRRNDRILLRSLSPRDIHDFCPKYSEAEAEMNKPFWQA
jgi:uncharacterized protein YjiS (DUF1127 family)